MAQHPQLKAELEVLTRHPASKIQSDSYSKKLELFKAKIIEDIKIIKDKKSDGSFIPIKQEKYGNSCTVHYTSSYHEQSANDGVAERMVLGVRFLKVICIQ